MQARPPRLTAIPNSKVVILSKVGTLSKVAIRSSRQGINSSSSNMVVKHLSSNNMLGGTSSSKLLRCAIIGSISYLIWDPGIVELRECIDGAIFGIIIWRRCHNHAWTFD